MKYSHAFTFMVKNWKQTSHIQRIYESDNELPTSKEINNITDEEFGEDNTNWVIISYVLFLNT